jgi:type II secretory pathway pseudopilin PulG
MIGIMGVGAAAVFPALTGYLQRSRDTARVSHPQQISTSLSAYYADKELYPASEG